MCQQTNKYRNNVSIRTPKWTVPEQREPRISSWRVVQDLKWRQMRSSNFRVSSAITSGSTSWHLEAHPDIWKHICNGWVHILTDAKLWHSTRKYVYVNTWPDKRDEYFGSAVNTLLIRFTCRCITSREYSIDRWSVDFLSNRWTSTTSDFTRPNPISSAKKGKRFSLPAPLLSQFSILRVCYLFVLAYRSFLTTKWCCVFELSRAPNHIGHQRVVSLQATKQKGMFLMFRCVWKVSPFYFFLIIRYTTVSSPK